MNLMANTDRGIGGVGDARASGCHHCVGAPFRRGHRDGGGRQRVVCQFRQHVLHRLKFSDFTPKLLAFHCITDAAIKRPFYSA